jgi:hypothetical protein
MEVFFLAFANDALSPLTHLKDEAETVYNYAWTKARDRHFMPFYAPYASVDQINTKMPDCSGQVTLFLYSGHAEDTTLNFFDSPGNTKGIAMHLKDSIKTKALKLVVLNGCATKAAVSDFLDLGVPVVIATQGSIRDRHAADFSKAFFRSLIDEEKSIIDSFNAGLKAAQTGGISLDLSHREIKLKTDIASLDDTKPLWEIFVLDKAFAKRTIIPVFNRQQFRFRVNEKLLKTIYTTFYNAGNPNVVKLWKEERESELQSSTQVTPNVKKAEKENAICIAAPMPIAVQLQSLLRVQVYSPTQKLKHVSLLGQLFQTIIEFLGIIMVSQLWEIKLKCSSFTIPAPIHDLLIDFFSANSAEREVYNYTPMIITIRNFIVNANHSEPIKEEIKKQKIVSDFSTIDESSFESVCNKLSTIREESYHERVNGAMVDQYAFEAEEELCKLFSMLGFIHRYELSSIHNIETLKKRYEQKSQTHYRHALFSLSQTSADDHFITSSDYMDSYGQILVRSNPENRGWMTDYLNLSPFVIDINAFEDKFNIPHIMFFDIPLGDNTYRFRDIINPEEKKEVTEVYDGMYDHILDELRAFRETMLQIH